MLVIGIFIRTGVNESPEFEGLKDKKQLSDRPVFEAWTQAWPLILLVLAANARGISGGYFTNTFMIMYAVQYLSMNKALVLECIFYVAVVQFLTQPIGAWIASKISPYRFLVISAAISVLLPYPMSLLVGTKIFSLMVLGHRHGDGGLVRVLRCHCRIYREGLPGAFSICRDFACISARRRYLWRTDATRWNVCSRNATSGSGGRWPSSTVSSRPFRSSGCMRCIGVARQERASL